MSKTGIRLGVYVLTTLILMLIIFAFSSQDATASQALSDSVLYKLLSIVHMERLMERYEILIRKLAHFSLYFALGLSSRLMFHEAELLRRTKIQATFCTIAFNALYAASDELHQHFVPGRSMQFSDVLLDLSGALTAVLLFAIIRKTVYKHREERKEHEQTSSTKKE